MKGYLGTVDVTHLQSEDDLSPKKMALLFIEKYGGYDGSHHKDWVLDQVTRILCGGPITVEEARWKNGHTELRYTVGECEAYHEWVLQCMSGERGLETYEYSEGIAP